MEQWQTIRHLAAIGQSQRFIAKTLGVSREAVARAVRQEAYDPYHREPAVQTKLDAFRDTVQQGIGRGLNGEHLLALVRQEGYAGSRATFYRWLEQLFDDLSQAQNACRFETGPGEQAQFDWSPYMLRIAGESVRVVVYALLLGYSRSIHFYPSLSERQDAIFDALEAGMHHFGGCCRKLLIDNARSMVLQHGRKLVWNRCFLAFCGHYRIQPIAATPVHPQTKGNVENSFRHLEAGALVGNEFRDWDHLAEAIASYQAARESRPHSTTTEAPAERFLRERQELLALPGRLFNHCPSHVRTLNNDGLISFLGNRYCVPAPRGLREVRVRTVQGRVLVICELAGRELIRHRLAPPRSAPVLDPACFEHLKARHRLSLATQEQLLRTRFPEEPAVETFLRCLKSKHPNRPERPLGTVLALLESVGDRGALLALAEAASLGLPEPETIAAILARASTPPASSESRAPTPLPCTAPALDVERPLAAYAGLLPASQTNPKPEVNRS